jgi:hypothetical protein
MSALAQKRTSELHRSCVRFAPENGHVRASPSMSAKCQNRTFRLYSSEGTIAVAEQPKSMSGPHDLRRSVAPLSRSAVRKATGGELRDCITRTFRPFR